jgi:hypothetical protein
MRLLEILEEKEMGKATRTDTSVVQIKLAFLGAIRNLCLLKNVLMQIDNIPTYQYSNYLSQVALCIELGLKSIISNTDNFECIHDIEKLFSATPDEFKQKIKSLYPDVAAFNSGMKNMEKMFVNFRYMEAESTLPEYFDEAMINSDKSISIKKAANLPAFQFSRILLEEIKEYEDSVRKKTLKQMGNIDLSDPDYVIGQYLKLLKNSCG